MYKKQNYYWQDIISYIVYLFAASQRRSQHDAGKCKTCFAIYLNTAVVWEPEMAAKILLETLLSFLCTSFYLRIMFAISSE